MGATAKHVAVLAFPFGTHAAPLLSLVHRIASIAPHIIFTFFSTAPSNAALFKDNLYSDNIKPCSVDDGLLHEVSGKSHMEVVDMFMKVTPGNYESAVEIAEKDVGLKVSAVLSDAFFWFAQDMAEVRNVPWVALWTAGPRSLLVHVLTDLIRDNLGLHGPGDTALDFIPDFSAIRQADLPEGIVFGDMERSFSIMLHKMGLALPKASAVLINSFEDLDSAVVNQLKSKFKDFLNIGPLALTSPPQKSSDEHGCLVWLDQQKPASVIYISFGSVMTPPPHEVAALAEALEECGFSFLWSLRGNLDQVLPKGFTERTKNTGKIVPWAPQSEVLNHGSVGVFLTHCGWNSVLESIIGGVPLICRPYFGDQRLNTKTVEAVWGTGVGVENGKLSKNGVVKALKLILSSEEGQKMRDKIQVYKELARKAVQSSGSTSKNFNTLVDMMSK